MTVREDLPLDLVVELEALETLPQDQEGPIADTYERLQGVAFLRAASSRGGLLDPDIRVYVALMQARELALFNMASLFRDASEEISKTATLDIASHHLRWIYGIARLTYDISNAAAQLSAVACQTGRSEATIELDRALREFSAVSMTYVSANQDAVEQSIEHLSLLDGASVFAHTTKNIFQLLDALSALPLAAVQKTHLNSHILRAAVHAINTKSRSYMMQFRLFHQIPEVLSFEVVPLFRSATGHLSRNAFGDAIADLRLANICLELIVSSLHPLVELMYPSEYYRFRAHLGQTSGSHSNDLARTVLRQAYLALAERFVGLKLPEAPARGSLERILSDEMSEVHRNISRWRATHIMLPRNILGAQTTSLIGSPNAEQVVQEMKNTFETRDSMLQEQRRRQPANSGERPPEEPALGQALRVMTGTVTRRKFPDVENRAGTFSSNR